MQYRRDYFVQNFIKSAKGNFTRHCKIWKGDHVLVAFSGGPSSRVMLHLLQDWISEKDRQQFSHSGRRMFYRISVVFVDIGAAIGMTHEERQEKQQKIRQICDAYGHETAYITLEDAAFHGNEQALRDYLSSFKTLSSREDALKQLIRRCIFDQAVLMGIDKVALGDSANQLAVNVISDIAKGRGASVPHTVSYLTHDPRTNVSILRPMKDLLKKEIVIFRHIHGLQEVFYPDLATRCDIKSASIDRLVESFITELQTEFPSTVHTIMRTTEKLKFPPNENQRMHCVMCGCTLTEQENAQLVRHLKEQRQPQHESDNARGLEKLLNRLSITQETTPGDHDRFTVKDTVTFAHFCCYGCQRTLSEKQGLQNLVEKVEASRGCDVAIASIVNRHTTDPIPLELASYPAFVSDNLVHVAKKLSRGQMREELAEFLLDDNDDNDTK